MIADKLVRASSRFKINTLPQIGLLIRYKLTRIALYKSSKTQSLIKVSIQLRLNNRMEIKYGIDRTHKI